MATKSKDTPSKSVYAKTADGTIQITLVLPKNAISDTKRLVLADLQKELSIPGFRKGKAPLAKVEESIKKSDLIEKILTRLLPKAFGEAITEHKIRPAMYPRFQLIKSEDGDDWQVLARTAEIPEVELGDYKGAVKGASKGSAIWTPDKGETKAKEPTKEDKYNLVAETLLQVVPVKIAHILLDEEVDAKLAKLLERIEKLGLSLESYLESISKTSEELRKDYELQAQKSIAFDLILNKIATTENITATTDEVNAMLKQAGSENPSDDQKRVAESIIRRQKVLDSLVTLI